MPGVRCSSIGLMSLALALFSSSSSGATARLDSIGRYHRRGMGRAAHHWLMDLERKNLLDLQTLFHSIPGALVQFEGLGKQRVFMDGRWSQPQAVL